MTNKTTPEWLTHAKYWAELDTESGEYRDTSTGYRIPRLACQDWRGEYLKRTLELIGEIRDESALANEVLSLRYKLERVTEDLHEAQTEVVASRHDCDVVEQRLFLVHGELNQVSETIAAAVTSMTNRLKLAEDVRDSARVESNRLLFENRALRAKLKEMTAARDEACELAYRLPGHGLEPEDTARIEALAKVGEC